MRHLRLDHVSEDWDQALVVMAHPDDVEFGVSAAVSRWTKQGKSVAYYCVSAGETGLELTEPERARTLRSAELDQAASIVGAHPVTIDDFPDGVIEYTTALRRAITAQIRRFRPQIVITNNFRTLWDDGTPNSADHIAVGQACLAATQDAGNRWTFPEQLLDDLSAWDGVDEVWAMGSPKATHGVDVADTLSIGVHSLEAHRSYLEELQWDESEAGRFLASITGTYGQPLGVDHAVAFEVLPLVAPLRAPD